MYQVCQGLYIEVSSLLKLFLYNLSNLKESCKLTSLCQDLSCAVKSFVVELNTPLFTTESLTRNIELIKTITINCFDHGVSYSKLFEVNSAFAIQKLAEAESSTVLSVENQFAQQTSLFMTVLTT